MVGVCQPCLSTGGLGRCSEAVSCGRDISPCGSEDATPGSRACVRVLNLPGRVGWASLTGAFWCASPFPLAAPSFCLARPPLYWGCRSLGPLFAHPSFPPPPFFFFFRAPPLSLAFFGFRPRVPWALALCFSFLHPPGLPLTLSFFFPLFVCPSLSLAFSGFQPRVPWALALCAVRFGALPLLGSLCALASFEVPACPLAAS